MWFMVCLNYNGRDVPSCPNILWVKYLRMDLNGLNRCLRSLVQAYMIFFAKTAIDHFPLTLFGSLADNYWNLWHVCEHIFATLFYSLFYYLKFSKDIIIFLLLHCSCSSLDCYADLNICALIIFLINVGCPCSYAWSSPDSHWSETRKYSSCVLRVY